MPEQKVYYDEVFFILLVIAIFVIVLILIVVFVKRCRRKTQSSILNDFLQELGYRKTGESEDVRGNEKLSIRYSRPLSANRYSSGFGTWGVYGIGGTRLSATRPTSSVIIPLPPIETKDKVTQVISEEAKDSHKSSHVPLDVLMEEDEEEECPSTTRTN